MSAADDATDQFTGVGVFIFATNRQEYLAFVLSQTQTVACLFVGEHQLGNLSHEVGIGNGSQVHREQLSPADGATTSAVHGHKVFAA